MLLDELAHTLGYSKFAGPIERFGMSIAALVAQNAELIVTGDRKHLLPIGTHQGIAIVTARVVVNRLEARLKT